MTEGNSIYAPTFLPPIRPTSIQEEEVQMANRQRQPLSQFQYSPISSAFEPDYPADEFDGLWLPVDDDADID